jgi:hypothetical protein
VHANPYSIGAAALVFICSITGIVAPSNIVDWNMWKMDPEPEVPTLLYIGRRGRVTERVIRLTDCFLVCYMICATERSKLSSRCACLGLP